MGHFKTFLLVAVLSACAAPTPIQAQASAAGMWRVEFVTQTGESVVMMTINQSGTKLTGHITDEYGEYTIEGRLDDGHVTIVWSVPEDGKMLEITMQGKLEGTVITGTARLGNIGEGPLTARRTGDAGDANVR
jgi:hypothetical protein